MTLQGIYFGLAILFTLLTIIYTALFIGDTIIIAAQKSGKAHNYLGLICSLIASIFWALALS